MHVRGCGMIDGGIVTLYVSDMDRAVQFYTETLGLKLRMRGGAMWSEIDAGSGLVLGLHGTHPGSPQPGLNGATQLTLKVAGSLEQVVEMLTARGVVFPRPIRGESSVRVTQCLDPDGNAISLHGTNS